ncbi:hypothetical protein SUGI_0785280 [Cryptomeria japonica]|uniref:THO complex subunit 4C-like n=1 Tax=Cryptomeria japonica TaxID=3369 RepID=UPI002414A2ED|nr:THO complex subunit 4C-like [Cryptomeria japonica]GLJ38537.1 hypothetical protein SUGI_0785280 [Cryptomeria japonica]
MTKSRLRTRPSNDKVNSGRRRSPYSIAKAFTISQSQRYKHKQNNNNVRDLLAESIANVGVPTETKLYISNLDGRVSDEDIRQLFSAFGELRRWGLHFDRKGEFMGTAEVVYINRNDATTAWKHYNNVLLDGKPIKIEFVADNPLADCKFSMDSKLPFITHPHLNMSNQRKRREKGFVGAPENVFRKRNEGNHRRRKEGFLGTAESGFRERNESKYRRRKGRAESVRKSNSVSAAQLDMDLESYHAQAMQKV